MNKEEKIKYGLIAVVCILLIVLLVTIFRATRKNNDTTYYEEKMKDKEEVLKAKQEVIDATKRENDQLTKTFTILESRDSLYAVNFAQSQKIYKPLYDYLKNVPVNIARISGNDDSIRAAFARR